MLIAIRRLRNRNFRRRRRPSCNFSGVETSRRSSRNTNSNPSGFHPIRPPATAPLSILRGWASAVRLKRVLTYRRATRVSTRSMEGFVESSANQGIFGFGELIGVNPLSEDAIGIEVVFDFSIELFGE